MYIIPYVWCSTADCRRVYAAVPRSSAAISRGSLRFTKDARMSPALLRALCGWLSPSVDRISLGRFAKCVRCWHRLRASEFGSAWRQDPLLHVGRHFSGSHNPQQLPSGVRGELKKRREHKIPLLPLDALQES